MEMDQKRITGISNCLQRHRDLQTQPFEGITYSVRVSMGLGINLGGVDLFPTDEEYAALAAMAESIRRREQAENTARLRDLGVEITETEETTDGQA